MKTREACEMKDKKCYTEKTELEILKKKKKKTKAVIPEEFLKNLNTKLYSIM